MKEILLSQDQITLVDDEDFEWLSQWRWSVFWCSSSKSFYVQRIEQGKVFMMAREIMKCPGDKLIDHKNHDTLDNQKHNLRICTHNQNAQNQRPQQSCSSIYKGVYWRKDLRKWCTRIGLRDVFDNRFRLQLGYFEIEEEAALAYDDAARYYFGEFAYLNFPIDEQVAE